MNTKLRNYNKEDGKYGLLHDNTIVKIWAWTTGCEQEIYFNYTFWYKLKTKFNRTNAWAYRKDFIAFSDSKRKLRKFILPEYVKTEIIEKVKITYYKIYGVNIINKVRVRFRKNYTYLNISIKGRLFRPHKYIYAGNNILGTNIQSYKLEKNMSSLFEDIKW